MIARSLGSKVYSLGSKEIGFGPVTLTEEGQSSALSELSGVHVLHWHGDQFDIPPNGTRLASTAIGTNQAFALGPKAREAQPHLSSAAKRMFIRWVRQLNPD